MLYTVITRGVTIHQWHGSVRFTVLEPRFGSVRCGGRVHVILPAILKEAIDSLNSNNKNNINLT